MKICSNRAVHLAAYSGSWDPWFRQRGTLKYGLVGAKFSCRGVPGLYCQLTGSHVPPHRLRVENDHAFRHNWATWMCQYAVPYYAYIVVRGEWAKIDDLTSAGSGTARDRTKA